MGKSSKIAWTESTWNPIRGCSLVSAGCKNCYAMKVAHRYSGPGMPYEGLTTKDGKWTGEVRVVEKHFTDPLRWKDPRRIFVNSMSDLFHPNVTDETIDRVFAVMALAPQHTFQVLTKRPERMRAYVADKVSGYCSRAEVVSAQAQHTGGITWDSRGSNAHRYNRGGATPDLDKRRPWPGWPLPNVWLGVSVEDQATADARVPLLLQTPAAVRWVSYEPALGPVDFVPFIGGNTYRCSCGWKRTENEMTFMGGDLYVCRDCAKRAERFPPLNWIVVGGESGPGARPFDVNWARSTVTQCREAGTSCFVKQFGAKSFDGEEPDHDPNGADKPRWLYLNDRAGADPAEWPEDLRVREYPKGV